jgi:hypothetical protein
MGEIRLSVETQAGTTVIRIFKDRASPTSYKEYTLTVTRGDAEQRFTITASDDQLQSIFKAVHHARIAPMVEQVLMLDRESYKLSFNPSAQGTSYQWFGSVPAGWEPLEEIADLVSRLAMRYTGHFYL